MNVKHDFNEIYVSSYCTNDCGLTTIFCEDYMTFYINKKGKNIGGISLDQLYGTGYNGTKALCFVGGSSLGLEAVCGVNRALLNHNKYGLFDRSLGACIYSYNLVKKNITFPDCSSGLQSMQNMSNSKIDVGQVGCGKNAVIGKMYSSFKKDKIYAGQGVSYTKHGNVKILVITILNSIGIVHENGILQHKFSVNGKEIKLVKDLPDINFDYLQPINTTLTAVITNIIMDSDTIQNLSEILHNYVASMIYPYATIFDGDCLFMLSTDQLNLKIDGDIENVFKKTIATSIKSVFV